MTRIVVPSWFVAIVALAICEQNALFAQEDSNASIMAGLDGNASEMAFSTGGSLVQRRNSVGTAQRGALQIQRNSGSIHRDSQVAGYSSTSRVVGNTIATRFEPFGLTANQGGLSNSVFRVYGNGYGFGYSRSYFGNYGQVYGTGYTRNYFGNYGYGYWINYGPKQ